jgi:hypothetical protein
MLTPVAPSTSNINDRLQCRRHLKAEEVMRLIADIYDRPSVDFHSKADLAALASGRFAPTHKVAALQPATRGARTERPEAS